MQNQTVCPNCGELYNSDLEGCPLCGNAPQVVETDFSSRKHSAKPGKYQRNDAPMEETSEELIPKEEIPRPQPIVQQITDKTKVFPGLDRRMPATPEMTKPGDAIRPLTVTTPAPARDGRGPMPAPIVHYDRRRIPRAFLTLSCLALSAAILVGSSFLLWKKDLISVSFYDKLAEQAQQRPTEPSGATFSETGSESAPTTPLPSRAAGELVPCTGIQLEQTALVFDEQGGQLQLPVKLFPVDTTDERSFSSSDPNVVKVSPVGIVTAVGPGEAVITVRCGEQSAECSVSCSFLPEQGGSQVSVDVSKLELIKDDMKFFAAGENYTLTVTNIPVGTPVAWESQDESVCTVDTAGHVTAVGNGTTNVIATVGTLKAVCIVRCEFRDSSST